MALTTLISTFSFYAPSNIPVFYIFVLRGAYMTMHTTFLNVHVGCDDQGSLPPVAAPQPPATETLF